MPKKNDFNEQNENVRDPKGIDNEGGLYKENTPGTPGAQNYGQKEGVQDPERKGQEQKPKIEEPKQGSNPQQSKPQQDEGRGCD